MGGIWSSLTPSSSVTTEQTSRTDLFIDVHFEFILTYCSYPSAPNILRSRFEGDVERSVAAPTSAHAETGTGLVPANQD